MIGLMRGGRPGVIGVALALGGVLLLSSTSG
jgi:hypothetical protein